MAGTSKVEARRAKFAAAQAALTPDQLEEQKKQNRTPSIPNWAASTIEMKEQAKRWFVEFLEDQHQHIDAEAAYFTPGAPTPDMEVLKEYARYLARSREGLVAEKLSIKTLQGYIEYLLGVMERQAGHDSLRRLRLELYTFISSNLVNEEGVSTERRVKPLIHEDDLDFIVSQLHSPEFLLRFNDMRTALNLNLFMLLIVDLGGRGGDIARNPKQPEHMCLRWEDVEFFTFQSMDDENFNIQATITVRWAKGQTLDKSLFRKIPLAGLLPHEMVLQDTLRLLLTLALMDDVLEGNVRTWGDLCRLRLPQQEVKTGRRIRVKGEMLNVPVLRLMGDHHRLTTTPVKSTALGSLFTDLGRFCGFEHTITPYALRRGVGQTLDAKTSAGNRRMIMGHKEGSKSFEPYRSEVATVDVPAIFRSLDSAPVLRHSSISLNRSNAAPVRPSDAVQNGVTSSKELVVLQEQIDGVKAVILTRYPTMTAAKIANDPLYDDYYRLLYARKAQKDASINTAYKKEYKGHFSLLTAKAVDNPHDASHMVSELIDPQLMGITMETTTAPFFDADGNLTGDGLESIQKDESFNFLGEGSSQLSDLGKDSVQNMHQSMIPRVESDERSANTRLHGLPFSGKGQYTIKGKALSAYMDLEHEIYRQGGNDGRLFEVLKRWYSVTHPLDEFPPGQEPTPGTYDCRFCGRDLCIKEHATQLASQHCYQCSHRDAKDRALELHDQLSPIASPCVFQKRQRGGVRIPCGRVFSSVIESGTHTRSHITNMRKRENGEQVLTCYYGSCMSSSPANPPTFATLTDQMAHVWYEHQIWEPRHISPVFCLFCQTWLIEPHEWKWHANDHMDDAQQIVSSIGYHGMFSHGRAISPRLCPFCYHDEAKPVYERLQQSTYDYQRHLDTHFAALSKASDRALCPCNPSMCTKKEDMDVVELREHLATVHGIESAKSSSGCRKAENIGRGAKKQPRKALEDISNQNPAEAEKTGA